MELAIGPPVGWMTSKIIARRSSTRAPSGARCPARWPNTDATAIWEHHQLVDVYIRCLLPALVAESCPFTTFTALEISSTKSIHTIPQTAYIEVR